MSHPVQESLHLERMQISKKDKGKTSKQKSWVAPEDGFIFPFVWLLNWCILYAHRNVCLHIAFKHHFISWDNLLTWVRFGHKSVSYIHTANMLRKNKLMLCFHLSIKNTKPHKTCGYECTWWKRTMLWDTVKFLVGKLFHKSIRFWIFLIFQCLLMCNAQELEFQMDNQIIWYF